MQRKDLSNTAKQELSKWLEEEEQQLSRRLNQRAQELLRSSQKQQSPNKKNERRKPRDQDREIPKGNSTLHNKDLRDSTHRGRNKSEHIGYRHTTAHYGTKLKDQQEANYQSTRNSDINTGSQIPTAKGAVAGKNTLNKSAKATRVELTLVGAQIAT